MSVVVYAPYQGSCPCMTIVYFAPRRDHYGVWLQNPYTTLKHGIPPSYVDRCLSGCTNTSNDGTKGRVCDLSCESGEPYGTLGCEARQGRFGANCRACYNDVTKARRQDTPENRAIM